MAIYEIPLTAEPQRFTIQLAGTVYQLTLQWRNHEMGGWTLDIADSAGAAIISGIPLVLGADLLEQYAYLNFGGQLFVINTVNEDAPTFDDLGSSTHLLFVTP